MTTAKRSEALPDVPSFSEFVAGYEASGWNGLCAPRNTPVDIVEKLNARSKQASPIPKLKARFADLGAHDYSRIFCRIRPTDCFRDRKMGESDPRGEHQSGLERNQEANLARCPRGRPESGFANDVCFSNRPFVVKRYQTIHQFSVDVARGLVLLFGIGAKALPLWDSKTRRNNLWDGLAVNGRQVQADIRSHLIRRPARDIIPPLSGTRVSSYRIRCCTVFMLLLWPVLGSSGTRCRQPICGA